MVVLELKSAAWITYLERQNVHISPSVIMNVEKMVAVQSTVFLDETHSTFSKDITRLRLGFNKTSCFDQPLCAHCAKSSGRSEYFAHSRT